MEKVSEYVLSANPPGMVQRTRIWITDQARKELESAHEHTVAMFEQRALKGFQGYKLRKEGPSIWAFGQPSSKTTRICGYFTEETERKHFVVCGVWKGKSGKGDGRPPKGDEVAERTECIKKEGVLGIPKDAETSPSAVTRPSESEGSKLLRAWSERRPS